MAMNDDWDVDWDLEPITPARCSQLRWIDTGHVEWRSVPGFDDELRVSSEGMVQQYDIRGKVWWPPKWATVKRHGYPTVTHRQKIWRVHRLVALAFVGPQPTPGHTVDHIAKYDGDWERERSDNRACNLRWATRAEQTSNRTITTLRVDSHKREREPSLVAADEEFRCVEGIYVSQYGRALNQHDRPFTPTINKSLQYAMVGTKRRMLHRLVAVAFIGSAPSEKHTVDHIDRDRSNNAVSNLRWSTRREQQLNRTIPSRDNTLFNLKKPVELRAPSSTEWVRYPSLAEASRQLKLQYGIVFSHVSMGSALAKGVADGPNGYTIKLRQNAGWSIRRPQ